MHEPANDPRRRQTLWRSVVLPVVAISLIAGAIWYLESGNQIPLLEDSNATTSFDDAYYPLDSRGIKLGPSSGPQAEIGKPAPQFALVDINGQPVSLNQFAGKTVLINFWASWCVPCRTEMPDLEDAYRERRSSGLVILGINLQEARSPAQEFATKYSISFPVLLDTEGDVAKAYRLSGLPESWIVGEDGTLIKRKIGSFTKAELKVMLDEAMSGSGGSTTP